MTPESIRMLIPQYLAGELSPEEAEFLESQMDADAALKSEVSALQELWQQLGLLQHPEPSPALRAQFYQNLNRATRTEPKESVWKRGSWLQLAAACLVFVIGFGAGHFEKRKDPSPAEVSQLQSQVADLRQTVALSLMEKPSASSRLQGVEWSSQITRPDPELITALLTTLNQDQNINVRLASLDALEKFTAEANVRKALEQSIPRQQSPLVQIALIDALVHVHDRSAAEGFKQLSGNQAVNAVVRQRAQWAVQKLSVN